MVTVGEVAATGNRPVNMPVTMNMPMNMHVMVLTTPNRPRGLAMVQLLCATVVTLDENCSCWHQGYEVQLD